MKGHVYDMGGSTLRHGVKTDLINWAKRLLTYRNRINMASTNFGTSRTVSNDRLDKSALDVIAEAILDGDFKSIGYYNTVKEFNLKPIIRIPIPILLNKSLMSSIINIKKPG